MRKVSGYRGDASVGAGVADAVVPYGCASTMSVKRSRLRMANVETALITLTITT